jgi:hypothetical protein
MATIQGSKGEKTMSKKTKEEPEKAQQMLRQPAGDSVVVHEREYDDHRNGERNKSMQERNEKEYLVRACYLRFREAKAEAAAIAAKRRSEFEALLEKTDGIDEHNRRLGQMYKVANSAAARAKEQISRLMQELGISLELATSLAISYGDWPQCVQHCMDDRWRAENRISRLETEAAAQIERASMETLIQLMDEHLPPAEASVLVQAIPAAAELIPELKREDLNGEPDHAGEAKGALRSADSPF